MTTVWCQADNCGEEFTAGARGALPRACCEAHRQQVKRQRARDDRAAAGSRWAVGVYLHGPDVDSDWQPTGWQELRSCLEEWAPALLFEFELLDCVGEPEVYGRMMADHGAGSRSHGQGNGEEFEDAEDFRRFTPTHGRDGRFDPLTATFSAEDHAADLAAVAWLKARDRVSDQ